MSPIGACNEAFHGGVGFSCSGEHFAAVEGDATLGPASKLD